MKKNSDKDRQKQLQSELFYWEKSRNLVAEQLLNYCF